MANDLGFKNPYSSKDNDKILKVINRRSMLEMRPFNISQMRLNRLVDRREKLGEFRSLQDLLEIEGFGIRILEKFCDSIIQANDVSQEIQESMLSQKVVKKDSFVSPSLLEVVRNKVNSIVSFHIDLNYFAWAKIVYLPNDTLYGKYFIEEWHCHEIENVDKRLNLSTMSRLLVQLIEHIPEADAYIIEAMSMVNTAQGGQAQIMVNVQKAQFYAMLVALMSARRSLNISHEGASKGFHDNVYFLRSFLPSRLYKYLVGNEKVAAEQVVDLIFEYNEGASHVQEIPKLESINVPSELKDYFKSSTRVQKEYLGNSLLVGLTFMKLCIQRCPKCIETLRVKNKP